MIAECDAVIEPHEYHQMIRFVAAVKKVCEEKQMKSKKEETIGV